jgi:FSR family fosmidomycin resistance protein-like MFS transporter
MDFPAEHHLRRLATHAGAHAAVDFACFYVLFARFSPLVQPAEQLTLGFLLYNVLAFGLQPLIGFLCDHYRSFPAAAAGCALVLVGLCLPQGAAWAALVLCAFGNAWFHVGAGSDVLLLSHGRMADNGAFVATGAVGVALGTLAGQNGVSAALPIVLLSAVLLLLWWMPTQFGGALTRYWIFSGRTGLPLAFFLLLLAVAARSFAGAVMPAPWRSTGDYLLLAAGAAALGKALGGVLADVFGARRVSVLALALSVPLLALFYESPALSAIGLVLFNIPMPVTLCAVADLLPYNPGLAFGLTTLALLVGVVPVFLVPLAGASAAALAAALSALAAGCLLVVTRNRREVYHETV